MDYLYENLGDERFQEFCHSLISKEFPNAQAFPVGQPDGGRDSVVYLMDSTKKEYYVFQVKFVRNPRVKDTHKWLSEIIKDEIKKIEELIPKGATRYYLLTNVAGTAHLDRGSIDKTNKILEDNISIPSMVWWRDDLSRLFEKDPLFKWSYLEVLNGQDVLNSLLFNDISENKERRESVIRAYLADQYNLDNEVKFRQIDLQTNLFDLFTDLPIRVKKFNEKNKKLKYILSSFDNNQKKITPIQEGSQQEEVENIGAASFLLNSRVQNDIQKILLEGGPGQGKSTISQYVSQVHRIKLLKKTSDINTLPDQLKSNPIRLPFKIDLRHIALWVENKNPYKNVISEENFSIIWRNSLEAFLIGHIYYHSQLEGFGSDDLIAILKQSPILIVFDGFDEIANIKVRKEVIDFINTGITRLSVNAKSIQLIITSRPAVFSDSAEFSIDTYPHFELTDINKSVTDEYVKKWIKANRLNSKESAEIKRLVNEKLEMPHLKDLAKSPMQLAIFISLLRTKGESLPNKRTAMYDSYVELFFDRESEKSSTIRDNRALVIDIHQYLGWILHSEAELYKNSGTIGVDALKTRLKIYLENEGYKTDIADKLFDVVKDRVCALASRVQGTFEFEVQPLREYFCAKYLYKTSPYSPAGYEKLDTLPDRFDAISRNSYWQNVLRFFAGCFSKGELSMLIQKLKELQNDDTFKYTDYPRIITSQLLSDYVFTQYPLLLKDVVNIIVDGINIGAVLNQGRRGYSNDIIVLPNDSGRLEIINECFRQLKKIPSNDYALELISIIRNNQYNIVERWTEYAQEFTGKNLTTWLRYAYSLQIIYKIDEKILENIIFEHGNQDIYKRLQIISSGNKVDIIDKNFRIKKIALTHILENNLNMYAGANKINSIQFISILFSPMFMARILDAEAINLSFINFIFHRVHYYRRDLSSVYSFEINDEIDNRINFFVKEIRAILDSDVLIWRRDISLWDKLIESARGIFQDCWRFTVVATIAAGIKSKIEECDYYSDINDMKLSLVKRIRCARMKSGNIKYWENVFSTNQKDNLALLVFLTWATPKSIISLSNIVEKIINELDNDKIQNLINGLKITTSNLSMTKSQEEIIENHIANNNLSNAFKYLLSFRFSTQFRKRFIYNYIDNISIGGEEIIEYKLDFLISDFLGNTSNSTLLEQIKISYAKANSYTERHSYSSRFPSHLRIPVNLAEIVMENPKNYPNIIASLSERSCRINANQHVVPVGKIANDNEWSI